MVHVYAAIREDIMSKQSMISTMVSGFRMFGLNHHAPSVAPTVAPLARFGGNRAPLHPGRFLARFNAHPGPAGAKPAGGGARAGHVASATERNDPRPLRHHPDTALRLAACFGVDAGFWPHLQADWDYTPRDGNWPASHCWPDTALCA